MRPHDFYSPELYRGNARARDTSIVARMLADHSKSFLRFLTCGSVDDGKSTLIGRLLYESQMIYEDQLATLEKDSRRFGTTGDEIDFALLVDGLEDERQQGITIDVAYRFFTTAARAFVVADTPGHEQYTRNMATGASNSDLAVILVDARKGVLPQTKRHAAICSLLGISHMVLAVNKIDLVGYDKAVFDRIVSDFTTFAAKLSFTSIVPIPLSARFGDNVTSPSGNMAWYQGDTLLHSLETVDIDSRREAMPFRMAVQWVNRPNLDFRGYCGTVGSGTVRVGDRLVVATSGRESTVKEIIGTEGEADVARAGDAVTLTLADEIDISRGDLLCPPGDRASVADQFHAHVLWMAEEHMLPGRQYLMRIGMRFVPASITAIRHKLDVEQLEHLAADELRLNEIAVCNIEAAVPVAFDPYKDNQETGGFILIDRFTNATVGVGMIDFALRRATNIHQQRLTTNKEARSRLKSQKPTIVWFTGLSGSGKSTIADLVERRLHESGYHTYTLDGDNVRHGLNRDLGFTDADRVENIRRIGEVAKLMVDAGLIVLCSFISPFTAERQMVRERVEEGEFMEVFVDTPLEECMKRDPKGLYAKAQAGQIKNFTGFDSPYEPPPSPELHLLTVGRSPDELADEVLALLREHRRLA
jgi:bifunctional enzyme CysN/CysC